MPTSRVAIVAAGAALLPSLLALASRDDLALLMLLAVCPFVLGGWLRYTRPAHSEWRTLRAVCLVLASSLGLLFAQYWLSSRADRIDASQWLGLATAVVIGTGVGLAGIRTGQWMAARRERRGAAVRSVATLSDVDSSGHAAAGRQCPACGSCYDDAVVVCAMDGHQLSPMPVPRTLRGRYQLTRQLGRGGMGTVYEALDTALDRRVAIKMIGRDLVGQADAAARFEREARAAARFNHPNVVTVYDYGVAETQAFLVMEPLDGRTLRQVLEREERLPPARALRVLRDITNAVDAAHRQHLLHLDLKPENVILVMGAEATDGPTEHAKVLDFGLAQLISGDPLSGAGALAGGIGGTPCYMAPERLRGEPVDARVDTWALAVMAFEMLTGTRPFAQATTDPDGLAARETLATLPAAAQAFFSDALAIDRTRRPSSATEFQIGLEGSFRG